MTDRISRNLLILSATLTLAVSIGANTTLFSVADSILVRPLPYPGSDRIDWISERSGPAQQDIGTAPDYFRIRDWNRVFEAVAAFNPVTANWTGVERPEQLDAAAVTASFFRVMATPAAMGRYVLPDDEGTGKPHIVVLSYAFWQSRLGGDPNILGNTIAIDRVPRTIVGVMPQGFDYPRSTALWMPEAMDDSYRWLSPSRGVFTVSILARRRIDASPQAVQTDLNRMETLLRAEYHVFPTKFRWDLAVGAMPLQQHLTGQLRPALLALSGSAGLVLLIACVNLANLLLARAGNRQREIAVRLALGASRSRIALQTLKESLLLALPGGAAGIGLSWIAVRLLNTGRPAMLLRYPPVAMDLRVLAFTCGLTIGAAMLFGLAPALFAAGIRIHEALKSGGTTHSGAPASSRLRKLLLAGELAVSLVLLIGAGLLARTFLNLAHTDLGFRTDHLLTFRINPIGPLDRNYSNFYNSILERLQQLPMARSAALALDIPLRAEAFYASGRIRVADRQMVPFNERPVITNTVVSPGFFGTLGIPLQSGRIFDARDAARPAAPVTNYGMASAADVVVNQAFVRKLFPAEDPLGRRIVFGPDHNPATWTIIGVVGDIRGGALGEDPPPMIYRCTCEGSGLFRAGYLVRTAGDPKLAIHAVEEQVHAVDRDQPIFDVKTMDERREAALTPERFQLAVIGCFAGIAILLAAAGVYGVTSYLVARRTREIGVRMALGARPGDVAGMVLSETLILVLPATAAGLGGAWALTRYLRSMLYGVTELDAAVFGLAAMLLVTMALAASLAPARLASRIDPMRALREE